MAYMGDSVPLILQGGGAYNNPTPGTFLTPDAPGKGTTVTYASPSPSGLPTWVWLVGIGLLGYLFIGGAGRRRSLF
jgi:hypothetical protein